MTPFQEYSHSRWIHDFPQWAHLREDIEVSDDGAIEIRYTIPSPANPKNVLCLLFTPYDVTVMFADSRSHEHYDPDLYVPWGDDPASELELWDQTYRDALDEFVKPVLADRLFVVWYDDHAAVVPDVQQFVTMNHIPMYKYESWSRPRIEHPPSSVG